MSTTELLQRFKPIELEDRAWVAPLYRAAGFRGSEYNFVSSFIWRKIYGIEVARYGDHLLVRMQRDNFSYLFPSGHGDPYDALIAMEREATGDGHVFCMHSVPEQAREYLEERFPGKYEFTDTRQYYDYIYEREKLATLAGKKLHQKRNFVNRFRQAYPDWAYESIGEQNIEECRAMSASWYRQRAESGALESDLANERTAVGQALDHFAQLGLRGGLLRVHGEVVALSIGSPHSEGLFEVHIEKAFGDISGAYQMMNQQFVLNETEGYTYLNREDDMGEDGLRQAKLSYRPDILLAKYNACLK